MKNKTTEKYEWIKEYSAFELFTMSVINISALACRIFNLYLVCCWCQTILAAIMAVIAMAIACSLVHGKIYNFLSNGEYYDLFKKCVTCVMLEGDPTKNLEKLNKISRENRWAILLFQGILTCVLKFTIG